MNVRIEAATTNPQWAEVSRIRAEVFTIECGFPFTPLPGPGANGVWHLLARNNFDAIGTLSVVETTGDRPVHERYGLTFGDNERVARYTQLAILRPYRKRGIFNMLMESAQNTVIRPNGFAAGWLLYPAAHACSSNLTMNLGFVAGAPPLPTEFGSCRVLIRRECTLPQISSPDKSFPIIETCPI